MSKLACAWAGSTTDSTMGLCHFVMVSAEPPMVTVLMTSRREIDFLDK